MAEILPARSSVEREQWDKNQDDKINTGDSKRRRSSLTLLDSDGIGFQMRPTLLNKFNHTKVESVIETIIRDYMSNKQNWTDDEVAGWSSELAGLIGSKVKEMNFPRYKLVTVVTMGEQIGGGVHIGMKCLWDADTDVYANFTYTTDKIYVIGTVCGIFYY